MRKNIQNSRIFFAKNLDENHNEGNIDMGLDNLPPFNVIIFYFIFPFLFLISFNLT